MIHVVFICTCGFDFNIHSNNGLNANFKNLMWSLHFESVFSSQMRLCDGGLWMEVRDTGWKVSPGPNVYLGFNAQPKLQILY